MIRHKKRLRAGDTATAGVVPRASDWNAAHDAPPFVVLYLNTAMNTAEPSTSATPVELGGGMWRTRYDFSFVDDLLLSVVSGYESNTLRGEYRAQFSVDEGVSWEYFDGVSGPRLDVSSAILYGDVLYSGWQPVGEWAKREAVVRIVTLNSDGVTILPGSVMLWGR